MTHLDGRLSIIIPHDETTDRIDTITKKKIINYNNNYFYDMCATDKNLTNVVHRL